MQKGNKMKMKVALIALVAAFVPSTVANAEDKTDLSKLSATEIAEMGARVKIANGLIALGRKDGDALYVMVGAKMLSDMKADVVDPETTKAGGKPAPYDIRALISGAASMKGAKEASMSVPMSATNATSERTICYWNYKCDLYYCGEFWDCGGY